MISLPGDRDWVKHSSSETVMWRILTDLVEHGTKVSPRGRKVIEIEDYTYFLKPEDRWQSFQSRKLSIDYIRREFLWYLFGDRYDHSIVEYAKLWEACIGPDDGINSNYGQYIFDNNQVSVPMPNGWKKLKRQHQTQLDAVLAALKADKDTRRAAMMIAQPWHFLIEDHHDYPCTYCIGFRIRNNELNMSVHMRSQDAIHGFGNDVPVFSIIHELVCCLLQPTYPQLRMGLSVHHIDSFHAYERHWPLIDAIVIGEDLYCPIDVPAMTIAEADLIYKGVLPDPEFNATNYPFLNWLTSIPNRLTN